MRGYFLNIEVWLFGGCFCFKSNFKWDATGFWLFFDYSFLRFTILSWFGLNKQIVQTSCDVGFPSPPAPLPKIRNTSVGMDHFSLRIFGRGERVRGEARFVGERGLWRSEACVWKRGLW